MKKTNRIRKIFAVSLSVLMVLSLSGCGQSNSYEIKSTINNSGTEEGEASEQSTELTVWCWDPVFNISAMEIAGEMYASDHPDVTVKVEEVDATDIIQKMSTAIKAGKHEDLPDILLMKDSYLGENLDYYDGSFADLTNSGINYSDFAAYKADMGVYQGKNYSVPFDSGAAILCLRTDILASAGYSVQDFTNITWSEFIQKGIDIKNKTGYSLLSCASGSADFLMMLVQSGGEWLSKDGKPYIYDNNALRESMQTYKQLVDSGVLVEKNNWDAYTSSITESEVAGAMNGCWITGTITSAENQSGKWAMTTIPRLDNVEGAVNYSNCGGSSWLIIDTSEKKDLAIDFMKTTFGSSSDFYSKILPVSGALATYLPASESSVYQEPQTFFGGQKIYEEISEYTGHVPAIETDTHNATVYDKAGVCLIDYVNGGDLDSVLRTFQQQAEALY